MDTTSIRATGQWPDSLRVGAEELSHIVDRIWGAILPLLGSKQYTGCVIQFEPIAEPSGIITMIVGDVGRHEERLLELNVEKTSRVRKHHLSDGHLTSSQSRDPHRTQLGGAIIARRLIISVAGLTEEANEAMGLSIGLAVGALDNDDASAIASLRPGRIFNDLRSALAS